MVLSHLVHDRAGSGEPVVLIHGIGHRRAAWAPIFDRLAAKYDVIAVDLAGFGESAPYRKDQPYDMDNACRDLAANFEEWGVHRPHVVGNSLGGAIALELAARDLVSSATALSPAGFFGRLSRFRALVPLCLMWAGSHAPDAVLRAVSASSAGRRVIGFPLYVHPERATAEATYGDCLAMKRGSAFLPTLQAGVTYVFDSRVDVPTTVAWGTADRLLPYAQSRTAKLRLPGARHVPLAGCGHVPMIDDPDTIIDLVDETIGRESGATDVA
ncbi:alpha/beta fold hydrolase [Nocardioides sp. JQ2195]|uniref:alpha/beta fold hydrolase n=1 Tax=Nocardioides sp. JQ2195 TaxID=2592334 RepID=UPI00143E5027|nr:alpha/beta fold hydrolase [Nocardioides sp. JQ2195]QIX27378.1 alpha/beta fold hydrolase [Nocardioides sp. JQ2195]